MDLPKIDIPNPFAGLMSADPDDAPGARPPGGGGGGLDLGKRFKQAFGNQEFEDPPSKEGG